MKIMFSAKAILVLATAVLLATVSIVAQTPGEQKSLTGVVSDTMCGPTHMMKDKPDAECLRYCVKQGTKYALVVGKTVYTLEGHEAELDKYAAQKVTAKGTLKGETLTVESVRRRSNFRSKLAGCCAGRGPDEHVFCSALL
jgi:predicted lipoprotein